MAGQCLPLIEGEEHALRDCDFVHCPPDAEHIFVGAGAGPSVIFMTGARRSRSDHGLFHPRSELALRHGAGVETETASPAEAYAPLPRWRPGSPPSSGEPALGIAHPAAMHSARPIG